MAERPSAHHSGRDSRDPRYRDGSYRDSDHRGGRHRDGGYQGTGDWDTDHRNTGYRDTGYGDHDYRDRDYRAGYQDHGYRDHGYQDHSYQDRDYPAGYGHRGDEDRDYRDRLPSGYAERHSHTGDGRGWAGEDTGALDRQNYWADEDRGDWTGAGQRGWGGEDHRNWTGAGQRGWESGVWDWAAEDRGADAYQEAGYQDDTTGGAEGNERLTALTGSVLLVLFAAEGLTILSVHQLLTLHFFLGMLLIGPVALKVCSVLYRFVRYYTGAEEYHTKGPPAPLLRILGPVVMITSLTVLGTGVMLAIVGPSGVGTWLFLHRASFILWFGAMTVHVLAYVWRLPRLIGSDLATRAGRRAQEVLAGRAARWLLLTASLLTGLLLAVLTVHRTGIWLSVGH
jgi:hypothetical protein